MSAASEARWVKPPNLESSRSGVSWGAIFAGGVTAAAVSIILLAVGAGLGFATISPYAGDSTSVTTLAVGAVIWLVIVQWVASIFGGYIAGRLRTKWADHHSDEVFFRDTAHGLLAWGAATLLTVGIVATGATSALSTVATVGATAASNADDSYFADQLFRTAPGTSGTQSTNAADDATRAEGGRLLVRAVSGSGTDADQSYLAESVAARTGISPEEAQKRVADVTAAAKEAADAARKASAVAALVTGLSLLIGAFIAAVAGALGGRARDELSSEELSGR